MRRYAVRLLAGMGMAWLGTVPGLALAQGRLGSAGTTSASGPASLANPYNNPYMNPFLNPYATMNPAGRNGTMLYFLAARQQQQQAEAEAARASTATAGPPPMAGIPGGAAAHYFQRSIPVSSRATGYYRPSNRYYPGLRTNQYDPGKGR